MSQKNNDNTFLRVVRHVSQKDWMDAPETKKIFDVIQGNIPDHDPQILFVGGCVRNVLLGQAVDDIDLATVLHPEEICKILESAEIKVVPTGIAHGTVTAVIEGRAFEITTLRKDEETDGRRATVSYTSCWIEDAKRRDFTMNTLLMDRQGNVYDPLECGLKDIDQKKVVFVGDAAQRIEEDHLRILRFFRFSALYGEGEFDQDGLQASRDAAKNIKKLSKERITQEFFKIIASEKPYDVLDVMFAHNILKSFDFEDYDAEFFKHFCTFQSRYGLQALSSRLFVMAAMNFDNIKAMEQYVLFPKVFLKDMRCIKGALNLPDLSGENAVKESLYRFGRSVTAQVVMIELVQDRVMNRYAPRALEIVQNWEIPTFPVTGRDLIAQGHAQGPDLGRKLEQMEDEWIKNGFRKTKV